MVDRVQVVKYNLPHSNRKKLRTGIVGFEAGTREPGQVETGASAEIEWAWELQSERPVSAGTD